MVDTTYKRDAHQKQMNGTAIMYLKGDQLYDTEANRTVWFGRILNKEETEAHSKKYMEHNPFAIVFPSKEDLVIDGVHTCYFVRVNSLLEDECDLAKSIRRMHKGQKILDVLHMMDDMELRNKLWSIVGSRLKEYRQEEFFDNCGASTRTLIGLKCKSIQFDFYDSIVVDHTGISLKFEHTGKVLLIEFNDHFTLGE